MKTDVLVLGGGIIGTTTALELQRAGRQVLLLDRGQPGFGCSYGNAGWITPCFAMPLPQPGMFWKSIGWLLDPDSPLYIQPRFELDFARWMLTFLRSMNERKMRESIAVLTEVSKYSLNFYRDMASKAEKFGFDRKGLLMVSGTQAGLKAAVQEMELMAERGVAGKRLTSEEVLAMEPSLKPIVRGGVYFPDEAHAEPLQTVQAILREFESAGGKVQPLTEAYDFKFSGNKIQEVITTRGRFEADLVVLATGSWSHAIARQLRVSVPILGGKGYSLITESFTADRKPRHPIMIVERKIAVTPRADSVRLAGTLELVDQDEGITPRRVQAILRGSHEYMHLPKPEEIKLREIWRGLRPCTPDGVPMIGFSKKYSNLFYNTGHQMLGLQSSPGCARLAGDLVMKRAPIADPKPFLPARFE